MRQLKLLVATVGAIGVATCNLAAAEVTELKMMSQYGIGYMGLTIMKHDKLIDKHLKAAGLADTKISWMTLGAGAAANGAVLAAGAGRRAGGLAGISDAGGNVGYSRFRAGADHCGHDDDAAALGRGAGGDRRAGAGVQPGVLVAVVIARLQRRPGARRHRSPAHRCNHDALRLTAHLLPPWHESDRGRHAVGGAARIRIIDQHRCANERSVFELQ